MIQHQDAFLSCLVGLERYSEFQGSQSVPDLVCFALLSSHDSADGRDLMNGSSGIKMKTCDMRRRNENKRGMRGEVGEPTWTVRVQN